MYGESSRLWAERLSVEALLNHPAPWRDTVLGAFCFAADPVEQPIVAMGIPCKRIAMQRLDSSEPVCEVWRTAAPSSQGKHESINYRHNGELLFGVIALTDSCADFIGGDGKTPLQQATTLAYQRVFSLLEALGYPYALRFWNYFSDINVESYGLERYRQFNHGRQDVFLTQRPDLKENLPAACALGTADGPLTIAFLAGRTAPVSVENPRQVSAYHYPPQYGLRRPMFSRAGLMRLPQEELLMISGTASVVGHETLHPNDVLAQTRETVTNIKALLTEVNRVATQPGFDLSHLEYKVYVRRHPDFPKIRDELAHVSGSALNAIYLHADICRHDLLLEIEATGVNPLTLKAGRQD